MPRGKLSEEQKTLLKSKFNEPQGEGATFDLEEIIKDMHGIGPKTAKKYLDSLPQEKSEAAEQEAKTPPDNETVGHVVMTEGKSLDVDQIPKPPSDLRGRATRIVEGKPTANNVLVDD